MRNSCWLTPSIHFAAATATDNVQYTLGDYWIERNSGWSREIAAAYGRHL